MVIGRDVELEACAAAMARAMSGQGQLVVLAGEAGIGKTTIAREVVRRAVDTGFTVRWGACWDADPSPYGVWIDALRRPDGDVCVGAAEELERNQFGAVDEPSAALARRRLFSLASDRLGEAADASPQLVVLEDLHWADQASIELLRFVTARLPGMRAVVVVTVRSDELHPAAVGTGGSIQHLELLGLGRSEVGQILAETLGREPSEKETAIVLTRTAGNPLFVAEVGRQLATGSAKSIPIGIGGLLERRMARLSSATDRLMGIASVSGTTLDTASLAAVADVAVDEARQALEEAVASGLLDADEARQGRWAFAHELVRATRYEALGSTDRTELHEAWLSHLSSGTASAALLDHHASRADLGPDDDRVARYALAAGDEAAARYAWADATERYERALLAAPCGPDGDRLRAEIWLGQGAVQIRTDGDAAASFEAAAAIGRELEDEDLVARAALGFGVGLGGFEVRLLDQRQVRLLEEAASALADHAPLRPMVLARLSVALSFVGSTDQRLALADEAIELAHAGALEEALGAGLAARCDALAGPDHVEERIAMSAEIIETAERIGDPRLELLGRRLQVVALLERRDLTGFDVAVVEYAATAPALDDQLYGWWVPLWRGTRAHADGRFDEARALRAEAGASGTAGGSNNADMLWLIARVFQALDQADAGELAWAWDEMIERHPDLFHQQEAIAGIQAYAAARFGDLTRCERALAAAGSDALEHLPRDQEWLTVVAQFLSAAVTAGNQPLARRCYDLLLPYSGLGVFEGAAAVDRGVTDRFLALGAAVLGDVDAARAHGDAALTGNADAGRLLVAQTRLDVAAALMAGTTEDVTRARALADQAADDFGRLGLESDVLAARLLAARLGPHSEESPTLMNAWIREGDMWAVTYGGSTVRIKQAKGIADLAMLVRHPRQELHVRVLEGVDQVDLPTGGDAMLDDEAVASFRDRLQLIEIELDEADRHADLARGERLAAERDALVDELTKAFGLGGRARTVGSDPDDRLRKAVSARVKASIRRLEKLNPDLGNHLRRSVRTGFHCIYDPDGPTTWTVETNRSG